MKTLILTLLLPMSSCLWSPKSDGPQRSAASSNSNAATEVAPVAISVSNFIVFQNTLIDTLQVPANIVGSDPTIHATTEKFNEFSIKSMMNMAYRACENFVDRNDFGVNFNNNSIKTEFPSQMMDLVVPPNAAGRVLMYQRLVSAYDDPEFNNISNRRKSYLACAIVMASLQTNVNHNLCFFDPSVCE